MSFKRLKVQKNNKYFIFLKDFIFFGLSSALQSLVGFLLLPFYSRYIGTEDFGAYSLIVFYTTLISSFFYFGTTASLNRFYYSSVENQDYKNKVISSNLLITILGAIFQLTLSLVFINIIYGWIFSDKSYFYDFKLLIFASTFGLISNYNLAVLRVKSKSKVYFTLNSISSFLNLAITIVLLEKFNLGIKAPIVGLLFGNISLLVLTFLFGYSDFKFKYDYNSIKQCFSFGFSIIFLGLSFSFLDWVDRIILSKLTSLSNVGIYSYGYRIGIVVYAFFSVPFSMAWSTIRMQRLSTENYDTFTSKIITIYSIIGWTLVLIISIFMSDIIQVIGGNQEYYKSLSVIPIILSAYLIYGYVSIFDIGIFVSKKIYFYLISFLFCIIFNIGFNYLTIPLFGFVAAAYVTLITYIIYILLIYYFSNKYIKIKIQYFEMVKIILPVIILLCLNNTIERNDSKLLTKVVLVLVYLFYLIKFVINPEEIKNLYAKLLNK